MRRCPTVAVVLGALAVAGCSGDGVPVETDRSFVVRQTLETFLDLCAEGRGLEAFEILNEPARKAFLEASGAEAGCDRILQLTSLGDESQADPISPEGARSRFREATIVDLSVTGGLAEARVRAADEESTVELEDQGERWTITSASLPSP